MHGVRGLKIAVLSLACAIIPSCSTNGGEGPKTPVGGAAGMVTSAGNGGSTPGAGTATGGNALGGSANPNAGSPATGGATAGTATTGGTSNAGAAGTTGAAGASSGPWTFPAGVTKPKIMIVGDSISAGPGCYKKFLLKALNDNKYTNFEFIGEYTDDCGGGVRHSAVSCSTAEQYTMATFKMPNCATDKTFPGLSTLMTTHKPDLVMLQLGVNDVWGGKTTENILGNYAKLIEQARAQNPKVVLAVARIQKIKPDCGTDETVYKRAEALVTAVPAWAQTQTQAESPVFVADLWTNSDWSRAETNDCVHPNDIGAERMGKNWYETLKTILKPD
jgi:hypothetical protein